MAYQNVKSELEVLCNVYNSIKKIENELDDTYHIKNDNLDILYKFIVEFKQDLAFDIRVLKATESIEND